MLVSVGFGERVTWRNAVLRKYESCFSFTKDDGLVGLPSGSSLDLYECKRNKEGGFSVRFVIQKRLVHLTLHTPLSSPSLFFPSALTWTVLNSLFCSLHVLPQLMTDAKSNVRAWVLLSMIMARSWPTLVAVRSMLWRMRFLVVRYSNDLMTRIVKVAAVLGARVLDSGSFVVVIVCLCVGVWKWSTVGWKENGI